MGSVGKRRGEKEGQRKKKSLFLKEVEHAEYKCLGVNEKTKDKSPKHVVDFRYNTIVKKFPLQWYTTRIWTFKEYKSLV